MTTAHSHGLTTSVSVGPGYDDTRIRIWNTENMRGRDGDVPETSSYTFRFNVAIKASPRWISITSYNEWGEGTQIEPAKNDEVSVSGFEYRYNFSGLYI